MINLNKRFQCLVLLVVIFAVAGCQPDRGRPRGNELLFCANKAVYNATIDSQDVTTTNKVLDLPEDATCPVWSSDGKQAILYRFQQNGLTIDDSLNLVDRQSNALHEIYRFGPRDTEWATRWLSDSLSILLLSGRAYQGSEHCSELFQTRSVNGTNCWTGYADVYQANVHSKDGIAEFTRLTALPEARCDIVESPTGTLIAYTRGSGCTAAAEVANIEILDSKARGITSLVNEQFEAIDQSNSSPQWSSNGDRILFSNVQISTSKRQQLEAKAEDWIVRTVVATDTQQGLLSPDGKKVIWWADNWDSLGITNIENGQSSQSRLPTGYDRYRVNEHGWSPDSLYFAGIERNNHTGEEIIRIIATTSSQIITVPTPLVHSLAWSPDSKWLGFSVWTPIEPNKCKYHVDIYIVKPDGTGLRKITDGQQFLALQCAPQGWRGYRLDGSDLQWIP